MFRFLVRLWNWIKSWFRRNKSPVVTAPNPTSPKPELSDLEYENLLLELLEEVVQGSNWGEIQGFLYGNNLEPEKLASWLRQFGQRWLVQPESHQELGHRLLLLSKLAKGELREVARKLGESIYIEKNEDQEVENTETTNNSLSLAPSQSDAQLPQTSVETLEEQDSVESQNAEYFLNKGVALCQSENIEKALVCFDQALKFKPDYYLAWFSHGIVLYELEKKEEALASYDQALKLKPDYYLAWFSRGVVLNRLGRKEEALASYDQALKLKPDNDEAWSNRGSVLSDLGRMEEAVASYDQALKIRPDNDIACSNRGNVLSDLERMEEALASYDQSLKIKPDKDIAWYNRGNVLIDLGRKKEALASYDQALKLKPDKDEAWYNRGVVLSDLGRKEEALASYDQALKLKPDNDEALDSRGVVLNKLGRMEEAVASYDQALKLKPDNDKAWSIRGVVLYKLGRMEEALASCGQALKLKPNNDEAWFCRGVVLYKLGRMEETLASCDQALKLKPDKDEAWFCRGVVLIDLGRMEEALASCDQALKIKPDKAKAWNIRGIAAYGSLNRNPFIQKEFVDLFCSEVNQDAQRTILSFEESDSSQIISYLKASLDNYRKIIIKTFVDDDSKKLIEQINQKPSEKLYQLIQQAISRELINFIKQPVSKKVFIQLKQDLLSHPHHFNPQLNLRGYQGWITSLEAELDKAINKDTHPLEWGKLYHYIGQHHYFGGCLYPNSFDYWHKAVASYNRALGTLTEADYPEEHLEVLQDLIKVQLGLGKTEQANQLRLNGLEVLKNLLNRTPSFAIKKQLQLKFVTFQQLNVDILINQGQLIEALTSAELSKNICLNNLLHTWQEQTVCPSYEQIQELLSSGRAIIYWHLSPQSLNTFILKANLSEPIILQQSLEQKQETTELPRSLKRLQEYKDWLKEWNEQYQDYRGKDKKIAEQDRRNHIWRTEMHSRLEKLKTILDIDTLESQLSDITQLILIPHQDLHRLPLHLLFDEFLAQPESTINYFPSLQIALTLQNKPINNSPISLLNLENPANDLPYAEIESVLINSMFTNSTYIDTKTAPNSVVTNSLLKTELQKSHNIFHFTGHGAYNQYQPQNSSLTLTGNEQITAQEISQLNLKSYQLISLAACETAITGQETIDTEYVGLVSGFLEAGATSVLSTLWTVEEISSAWLMIRFYQLYLEQKHPALTLKQAQQWLKTLTYPELKIWLEELAREIRDTHPNVYKKIQDIMIVNQQDSDRMDTNHKPYSDPYYWAAFTFTGGKLL